MAEAKRARRKERVTRIEKDVRELEKRHERGALSAKGLHHKVRQGIEDHHMEEFFDPRIEDGKVILYRLAPVWEREEYLDGKFILKTNLSPQECPTTEVVRSYKQLQQVERAFREFVSGHAKMTPHGQRKMTPQRREGVSNGTKGCDTAPEPYFGRQAHGPW